MSEKPKWITGYWTIFCYGSAWGSICSKHRSQAAAIRAAKACEKRGGNHHRILEVREVGR